MISIFPEKWELVSFFESEPEVLDPGQPWMYNKLTFKYQKEEHILHAVIRPSYGDFRFKYFLKNILIFDVDFHWVDECKRFCEGGKEFLLLRFSKTAKLSDTMIFTKPNIY